MSDRIEPSIGLVELAGAELQSRDETKTIIARSQTGSLLESLVGDYRVLSIDGRRRHLYSTLYLDTERLDFYRDHHNQKLGRHKVRYRTYVESNLSFFEVKHKTNKEFTEKHRLPVDGSGTGPTATAVELLAECSLAELTLCPVVTLDYERITLVADRTEERVTIDSRLSAHTSSNHHTWLDHVIVEVKQPRLDRTSTAFSVLVALGRRPTSISKYCVGLATCVPDVKRNRFLGQLRRLGVAA